MKALITAAGLGTRSGLSGKFRKEMLPIYDVRFGKIVLRPMVDCIITRLQDAGIEEFVAVLDPNDRFTRDYITDEFSNVAIVYQGKKQGFGDAVRTARDEIGNSPFILNAGDGLVLPKEHVRKVVREFRENPEQNILSLMKVDNPRRYGTAEVTAKDGMYDVHSVVEKSENPPSNLALCAFYALNGNVMDYLDEEGTNIELTPAINSSIKNGTRTTGIEIKKEDWVSVGIATEYVRVLQRTLEYSRSEIKD